MGCPVFACGDELGQDVVVEGVGLGAQFRDGVGEFLGLQLARRPSTRQMSLHRTLIADGDR